ncbi:hypothetical protein BRYFOR_07215 [Marvinbryantia formatexigens DSM 14469]|uniref:Uncharacterized protein n=1 Tax=Marvinbryantia formatexigens DSM 14469 TaxID=478749 RepID=C6LF14_9FIRM|nr:hypothetical protein BRYFOR_07215 [Marvinbryantia formatexigens DSM 14469]
MQMRKAETNIFVQRSVTAQPAADGGTGKLKNAEKHQTEATDCFCERLRNQTVQRGAEQQGKAEAKTADGVYCEDFTVGDIYISGAVGGKGSECIQTERGYQHKNMKQHRDR